MVVCIWMDVIINKTMLILITIVMILIIRTSVSNVAIYLNYLIATIFLKLRKFSLLSGTLHNFVVKRWLRLLKQQLLK